MSNKTGLFLILGLAIGGSVVFVYLSSNYQGQIIELKLNYQGQIIELKSELTQLQTNYNSLESFHASKVNECNQLRTEIRTMESNYNSILLQKNSLQNNYDDLLYNYKTISQELSNLDELLNSYSSTAESFSRIFNEQELDKIGNIVREITDESEDTWYNYQKIWDYVDDNIEYAYDIEVPYIGSYHYITYDEVKCYVDFEVKIASNYIQTPAFTLEKQQGDCEDQAILLYGMIKYYFRNIYGTIYNIYLVRLELGEGSGHFAVFMPVQDGNICILDPAGNYATTRYGYLTQKTASFELNEYNNKWSDQGYISKIEIYWVDDRDGSYSVEAEGDLNTIIDFFENR